MGTGSNTGVVIHANVYENGEPIAGYQNLVVESLSITADRSNAQRTTISLVIQPVAGTFWPRPLDMSDVLAPNGNELQISAGFSYEGVDEPELVPVGIFPMVSVTTATTSGDLTITVSASDRSWSISRRGLLQPYAVATDDYGNPTATVDQAITTLLQANTSGLPPIQYSVTPTANLAPATTYDQDQDPWAASLDLATGQGWELYVNVPGNVECYTVPDPSLQTTPDWTFVDPADNENPTIASGTRTLTADDVTNDQYVITDSDSAPTQWEQWDGNEDSPTNITGKFGRIPNFVTSDVSPDLTSAQLEATTDLLLALGQADTVSLTGEANCAVLIDDVCLVTSLRLGIVGVMYVVDGFTTTIPSSGDATTTYNLRRVFANSSTGQEVPVPDTDDGSGYYD